MAQRLEKTILSRFEAEKEARKKAEEQKIDEVLKLAKEMFEKELRAREKGEYNRWWCKSEGIEGIAGPPARPQEEREGSQRQQCHLLRESMVRHTQICFI